MRTLQAYMFCSMFFGPFIGPAIAALALSLPPAEPKILGVIVPFAHRRG